MEYFINVGVHFVGYLYIKYMINARNMDHIKTPPMLIFTIVPVSLLLSKYFIYQLVHNRIALKRILKFTLKQLLNVSVQSPSSGSALFELAKVTVVKIVH